MNNLLPTYRVTLNKNLLSDPLFFWFLKQEFHRVLMLTLSQGHIDLTAVYKFTIYSIPVQWGNYIILKIRANDARPKNKKDKKLTKISKMLLKLDPLNPKPVKLEFDLNTIINFVINNLKHYQELTSGGVVDYFGIPSQLWFDDYPIQTGTILKAVDYGTLDNPPLHLFDTTFEYIRQNLLDLFAQFVKYKSGMVLMKNKVEVTPDVNI